MLSVCVNAPAGEDFFQSQDSDLVTMLWYPPMVWQMVLLAHNCSRL